MAVHSHNVHVVVVADIHDMESVVLAVEAAAGRVVLVFEELEDLVAKFEREYFSLFKLELEFKILKNCLMMTKDYI